MYVIFVLHVYITVRFYWREEKRNGFEKENGFINNNL